MVFVELILAVASLTVALVAIAVSLRLRRRLKRLRELVATLERQCVGPLESLQRQFDPLVEDWKSGGGVDALSTNARDDRTRIESLEQWRDQISQRIDHLQGETQNLAVLPACHPERLRLAEELRGAFAPIIDGLVPVLFPNQLPIDDCDWMYRLPDRKFPYSLTFEEGMMIYHLVRGSGFQSGYEIATAFGMSSFFIGKAFKASGGRLISVDAYIEEEVEDFQYDHDSTREHVERIKDLLESDSHEDLPRGLQFAIEGSRTLGLESTVQYKIGCSPEGVPDLLDGRQLDFAFIDGGHFGEQPILDVQSVLPFLDRERCMLVFHDTQCEAVARAVHVAAEALETKPYSIHTRNRIVAVARGVDEKVLGQCREMTVRQFT